MIQLARLAMIVRLPNLLIEDFHQVVGEKEMKKFGNTQQLRSEE